MKLSRKRRRELKKLRSQTEDLLEHQREVLGHAGDVLSEAKRQAKHLSDEKISPKIDDAVSHLRPHVDRSVTAARRAANRVRIAVAPVVATALASTVKSLEKMESTDAARQVRSFGEQHGLLEKPKKRRWLTITAIGLGVAVAGAVGYTLWQAFRSDEDDMWVSVDES